MAHLLHLTASPRGSASLSRQISGEFVAQWLEAHPADSVTLRDIGRQNLPYVTAELIDAFYTPADQRTPAQQERLTLSDELVAELVAADLYVFSMPMYNFSVPAVFKAYIDLIVRIGVTVSSDWEGLLRNKRVVIVTARGGIGYGEGEFRAAYNFEDAYLRTVMQLVGVTDQAFIHIAGTSDDAASATSLSQARQAVASIVASIVAARADPISR
jgi:FMN-dependent NADH-azoreductase